MPNSNKPSGLVPVQYLNGSPWDGKGRVYCIPDTDDTNAYAIGDPVELAGSSDANGVPTGTGGPPPSVIPATKSASYYVLVADDPNIIFEIQEDNDGGDLAAADVGENCNLVAGANNGYISGWQLDSSSHATGSTLQMKLLRLAQLPGGTNAFGTDAKWWTIINHHVFRPGQTGI